MFREKRNYRKTFKVWMLTMFCVLAAASLGFVVMVKFEGEKPVADIPALPNAAGRDFVLSGQAWDMKSGLRDIRITLTREGKEMALLEKRFPGPRWFHQINTRRETFSIPVSTVKNQFPDGPALLTITLRDHSWRRWWNGNRTVLEKTLQFDTRPPTITFLSRQHNVSQGGAGLAIYRLSEPCVKSGILVGASFFPGHAGYFEDQRVHIAFFAVPFDYTEDKGMVAIAEDRAGNAAKSGFYHYLRKKAFRKDVLKITDSFLNTILPAFQATPGWDDSLPPVEQFLYLNTTLREQNNQTILANGKKSEPRLYWEGIFGRLPNAAPRAGFADFREYDYNGAIISSAVHLGVDLASLQHAPVPAANRGKVVFSDFVGIYGNLVCIDHGFGLMSIYGHLNEMTAKVGDLVEKGDIIGYTGTTGMAGGDHLHFGMFIDHVFVNPIEWWDASWIANNITGKIEDVKAMARDAHN